MKYLKTYENYKDSSDWKVGDIIIAINGTFDVGNDKYISYWSERGILVKDETYEIVEIKDTSDFGQTPEIFPIKVKDRNDNIVQCDYYLSKDNFITLDEWNLNNATKKYNL